MPSLSTALTRQIVTHGVSNLIMKKPLALSLEITHACNCNCKHCDKGGLRPGEERAAPAHFGRVVRDLKPLVAQISGGEPLLRDDVDEVLREIKVWGKLPVIVLVTNASLLTEERYLAFKKGGVDEFSISLDFPDKRHDENRGLVGLYDYLSDLIPRLTAHGHDDITMITVIRKDNLADLLRCAEKALEWNAGINISAYTALRTKDRSKSVSEPKDLAFLRKQIDALIDFKKRTGRLFTSESVLEKYYQFFANGSEIPNCRAGTRSMVVNPDGRLAPCAMQPHSYDTQAEMIEDFCKSNTCGGCLVSMRANTEKTVANMFKDGWAYFQQMRNGGS